MLNPTHAVIVPKIWGYEKLVANSRLYCQKILVAVPNGNACSIHYHKQKTETFHILDGVMVLELFDEIPETMPYDFVPKLTQTLTLIQGDTLTIPVRNPHRFWAEKEVCVFTEASTQHIESDSVRLIHAGPRPIMKLCAELEKYPQAELMPIQT